MNTVEIVIPTFNEELNIEELYQKISTLIVKEKNYKFKILFIDNCSTDNTQNILKNLANNNQDVKLIFNIKNFGSSKSHFWGVINTNSNIVVTLAADLQEPVELISSFLRKWEEGFKIVMGVKIVKRKNFLNIIKSLFYKILYLLTENTIIENSTGFGLYDKKVIDRVKSYYNPYPFLRTLVHEFGYPYATVKYEYLNRFKGKSKINYFYLYQIGINAIISNSILPIRVSSFIGFGIGLLCIIASIIFLLLKLIFWNFFQAGYAPVIISIFFLFGLIFIFIGFLGEYIGSLINYNKKKELIIEKERINFD